MITPRIPFASPPGADRFHRLASAARPPVELLRPDDPRVRHITGRAADALLAQHDAALRYADRMRPIFDAAAQSVITAIPKE